MPQKWNGSQGATASFRYFQSPVGREGPGQRTLGGEKRLHTAQPFPQPAKIRGILEYEGFCVQLIQPAAATSSN